MKPIGYVCGGPHDPTIVSAMAIGAGGSVHPIGEPDWCADRPAVTWGLLRGSWEAMAHWSSTKRPYLYMDHGYFGGRGHYNGYYRCVWNGTQGDMLPAAPSEDRWRALGQPMRPWRRDGRNIIVCPPSPTVEALFHDAKGWRERVMAQLGRYTDRPIIVREKGDAQLTPLSLALQDAHCLITFNSNAAIEAVLEGVPVFVGLSAARPLGRCDRQLHHLEDPLYPEREPHLHALAYGQFTLQEMRSGFAWRTMWGFQTRVGG